MTAHTPHHADGPGGPSAHAALPQPTAPHTTPPHAAHTHTARAHTAPAHEAAAHPGPAHRPPVDPADWDARYAEAERVWSGEPNGALVREVAALRPGRVLDVGCGEGADAVWLASRGWDVTALDVSRVALDRARAHAAEAGVTVTWVHGGLLDADLPAAGFDLVSAQYPALRRTPGADAERALLAAVAPGGTLLVVHHDTSRGAEAAAHAFDPDDWVLPRDVARLLDDGWRVEVDEVRERVVSGGAGAHHTHDVVLRARRTRGAAAS